MKNSGTDTETAPRSATDELEVLADSLEVIFQVMAFTVSLPFVYWRLWTKAVAIPTTEAEVKISCPYCRGTEVMEIPDASAQFGRILYTCCNGRCLEEFRS